MIILLCRRFGLLLLLLSLALPGWAQMVTGRDMSGYAETFGLSESPTYQVQVVESSIPGNVLWPGDKPTWTFQVLNASDMPLDASGKVEVIAYGTKGASGDIWTPHVFKISDAGSVSVTATVPAHGYADVQISPDIPAKFGGYALVVDLGPAGRRFLTSCVRTFAATQGRVQYPKFCLDSLPLPVLKRLDVHAIRWGVGYKPTTDKDFAAWYADRALELKGYQAADIAVLFMAGGGEFFGPTQPLGRPRPWLDDKGMMLDTKFDLAWLPSYDTDFQKFCYQFARDYGWPKGPINAFSLWNEPWEGISISGWGADMLRYREMYTHMYQGIAEARKSAGAQVLVGGCDSSSNAMDKLFSDGTNKMLPMFDFLSIHYQGLTSMATVKDWVHRKGPNGRVKIWDTESWVANTDDRVAALVAGDRAAGYDRAMGVYGGNICDESDVERRLPDGKTAHVSAVTAWSTAASVGATQHFIGERSFSKLLFPNGLPWVMLFDGLDKNPDDGTAIVVGDLGEEFGANSLPYRTARGFAERVHKAALLAQLAALPTDASVDREKLQTQIETLETLSGATLILAADSRFHLYDFYGNPITAEGGKIVVPLDGRGFFLRADGSPGSFAALTNAIRIGTIQGLEPIAIVAHDLTAPLETHPALHLSLTNVLNRPVTGTPVVTVGALTLTAPLALTLKPNETRELSLSVTGGTAVPSNTYSMTVTFDAGADGIAQLSEDIHVNTIAHRTITVDGNLDDWKGVLPQTVTASRASRTLTEAAWFPFKNFDPSVGAGFATGYLAYDDQNFYFAAKVADSTPDPGTVRFAARDDNADFYPDVSQVVRLKNPQTAPFRQEETATPQSLTWPAGVRHYSYRKDPELPAGNSPAHDNIQIAFNVLPQSQKPWYTNPPGVMPGFTSYKDTDYEYALNQVAPQYGGGTEIWRLQVPGMPQKHFYPRQPKSPFDGPVLGGKLVMTRDATTRLVECSIPWSEMPLVKQRLDAGQTVKFSFRVNDNKGEGTMELSRERSVAKRNGSFHVDWIEHWANELEFGWGK
jgi:hypothetical protein